MRENLPGWVEVMTNQPNLFESSLSLQQQHYSSGHVGVTTTLLYSLWHDGGGRTGRKNCSSVVPNAMVSSNFLHCWKNLTASLALLTTGGCKFFSVQAEQKTRHGQVCNSIILTAWFVSVANPHTHTHTIRIWLGPVWWLEPGHPFWLAT